MDTEIESDTEQERLSLVSHDEEARSTLNGRLAIGTWKELIDTTTEMMSHIIYDIHKYEATAVVH